MHEKAIKMFGKMVEEAIKNPESAPDKLVMISMTEKDRKNTCIRKLMSELENEK